MEDKRKIESQCVREWICEVEGFEVVNFICTGWAKYQNQKGGGYDIS